MTRLPDLPIAEKYRSIAAGFTERVNAVTDWDAPTPVKEWIARDVVEHLHWIRSVIADAVSFTDGPSALDVDLVHDAHVGMSAAQEFLRATGQFGQQQTVADDASEQHKLFALLGRDPNWRNPNLNSAEAQAFP